MMKRSFVCAKYVMPHLLDKNGDWSPFSQPEMSGSHEILNPPNDSFLYSTPLSQCSRTFDSCSSASKLCRSQRFSVIFFLYDFREISIKLEAENVMNVRDDMSQETPFQSLSLNMGPDHMNKLIRASDFRRVAMGSLNKNPARAWMFLDITIPHENWDSLSSSKLQRVSEQLGQWEPMVVGQ